MFAQMFEATSLVKFSRAMKFDSSAISIIKSWKFHIFYQSCPLSCTCMLLCVGQASWRSQILHIFTPQNLMQAFWCVVTLLYFLYKNYVKKTSRFCCYLRCGLNLVLNFTNLSIWHYFTWVFIGGMGLDKNVGVWPIWCWMVCSKLRPTKYRKRCVVGHKCWCQHWGY
jgi:hypothetical protein